uniref:Uncharacterized protein n=1 Tax=Oryza sativa subsp. japonica TaxID=39947 RepID=Q6H562_ORYSJ|nr:hypothetical protein [Oryza sativa Japonica Group]
MEQYLSLFVMCCNLAASRALCAAGRALAAGAGDAERARSRGDATAAPHGMSG